MNDRLYAAEEVAAMARRAYREVAQRDSAHGRTKWANASCLRPYTMPEALIAILEAIQE